MDFDYPIDNCKHTTLKLISFNNEDLAYTLYYEEPKILLTIEVVEQIGGLIFQLPLESYKKLKSNFPKAITARSIFVSYSTLSDFQNIHGPIGIHMIQGLCGLSDNEIKSIAIKFINPKTNKEIHLQIEY